MDVKQIIINSILFFVLLIAGLWAFPLNLPLSIVLLLAAVDNLDDVYFYATGKHFLAMPRLADVVLEAVTATAGIVMMVMSILMATWTNLLPYAALAVLGALAVTSSFLDATGAVAPRSLSAYRRRWKYLQDAEE